MSVRLSYTFIFSLMACQLAVGQVSTLYYNQNGELTISEMATHYRIATVNIDSGVFEGDVFDYRMDSTLLYYSYYGKNGIEKFYHLNEKQDTMLSVRATAELIKLPDSIELLNVKKEGFAQSDFIRKNDYPLIKKNLKPIQGGYSDDALFTIVEEDPEFPGGMNTMMNFLSYFLVYPGAAREKGIKGKVYVQFNIEPDGTVGRVKAVKGIGYGCDEAAEYAISKLPDWKPGYQRGKAVPVQLILPITFK